MIPKITGDAIELCAIKRKKKYVYNILDIGDLYETAVVSNMETTSNDKRYTIFGVASNV